MNKKILSFDLRTDGNKAVLYDENGNYLSSAFVPYSTQYPQVGWHEQRPLDWWNAFVESTHALLANSQVDKKDIFCLGISGHSLGVVPLDINGNLLREGTPIWSDIRAQNEVEEFFSKVDPDEWYQTTGNGFPAACYPIFKVMWYQRHETGMWNNIYKILGTKDYINYRLTGKFNTDFSYASGTGIYDLKGWNYSQHLIAASGIPSDVWPNIVPSTRILGKVDPEVAGLLGLGDEVLVVCGGVDNSCLALGARNTQEGRVNASLGSSAWIAVSSSQPVLDKKYKPYVFAHVIPKMFTSAVSIFSSGTTINWVRDNVCSDLTAKASATGKTVFDLMTQIAEQAPVGSNKLLFIPNLAGGTSQDASVHSRGAYIGLDLKHGQPELIRSAVEGIAMNLRLRLDLLRKYTPLSDEILFVGGGVRSRFAIGIFADVFNTRILNTAIDHDAAALGAAALAAVGCGLWSNFEKIDTIQQIIEVVEPDENNTRKYEKLLPVFELAADYEARISDALQKIEL
jgi:xylulokinase